MASSAHDPSNLPPSVPPRDEGSPPGSSGRFHGQRLFQNSTDALFVVNSRRRILFVNRAWEALTGLTLAEVKGQVCRRRPRGILAEKLEIILGALAFPSEVLQGQPAQTRRLLPLGTAPTWWQLAFFPLFGEAGMLAVLGKVTIVSGLHVAPGQPLSEKLLTLRDRHAQRYRLEELVGEGPAMSRLRQQIGLAAHTRLPVLLVGPPGTGKEWVARTIHQLGAEHHKSFASLDCARLPARILADLLFGTGQHPPLSHFYLRNVDHLPRDLQERLLERLETEQETPLSMCAGLDRQPDDALKSGMLLHDLYCRLSPLVLHLPPLKERMDDFTPWVERLLLRANRASEREVHHLSGEAAQLLRAHQWPGNLSELYAVLVAACLRAKSDTIEAGDLPFHLRHGPRPIEQPLSLDAILEQLERRLIVQALRLAKNNKSQAAEMLGIWRARLLRRMENMGISDQ